MQGCWGQGEAPLATDQAAYAPLLWDGFPLRLFGEAQFEWGTLLLSCRRGLPAGVGPLAFPMVSALRGQELGTSALCPLPGVRAFLCTVP